MHRNEKKCVAQNKADDDDVDDDKTLWKNNTIIVAIDE